MDAIMAMSKNRCIGLNGGIPWRVKEDFQWFKEFTLNRSIIVGKNTFDDLPKLKDRSVYFLSSKKEGEISDNPRDHGYLTNKNGLVGRRLLKTSDVFGFYDSIYASQLYQIYNPIISGGKKVYETFMPHITNFYVTIIDGEYEGDTYMSEFEHLFQKQEIIRTFGNHKVIKYYEQKC